MTASSIQSVTHYNNCIIIAWLSVWRGLFGDANDLYIIYMMLPRHLLFNWNPEWSIF